MVFSSTVFLFLFLPITIGVYSLLTSKSRNVWLLLCSIFFYAWGEPVWIFLLIFSTVVNYGAGLMMDKLEEERKRKAIVILACLYNILILFVFKYLKFTVSMLDAIVGTTVADTKWIRSIVMPIGISFFTFQIMSYIIDVYRRQVPAQRSYLKLSLYIMLFPQMIAGPIVRYQDIAREIDNRSYTLNGLYNGTRRFMVGFVKKVIISNRMAEIADLAFGRGAPSSAVAWLGAVCYALQIFFDFSAYSDMAIGMGEMFGFHFLENFNYPYISTSIQEFWRRWHISLSSWFKDYLYIPLGGNRRGKLITYRNLIIVFLITGLWHGASWNFILWGLFHGVFQLLERSSAVKKVREHMPVFIMWIITMIIVLAGWVLFRADDLSKALVYLKQMFSFNFIDWQEIFYIMRPEYMTFMIVGIVLSTPIYRKALAYGTEHGKVWLIDTLIIIAFILAILYLTGSSFNPFIYFRF